MAKRRKKEPIEEVIGGVIMLAAFGTFYATRSISVALSVGFILLVVLLFIIIIIKSKHRKKINASGILQVDKMTGIQFEEFLMIRYKSMGFDVKDTPKTGDYGADLILQRDSKKIVIQAKRYSKAVGIKAVQEVTSAKPHYKADEAWVVTNNYFTKAAMNLASSNNVRLIDREQLIALLNKNKVA